MYAELTPDFNKSLMPDDAIVEAPSLVTPFLLRKQNKDSSENSNRKPIDEYIKSTTVTSLVKLGDKSSLTINDFYKTSAGELLLGIGLSRVREFTLDEKFKRITSKIRKGGSELTVELEDTRKKLSETKFSNVAYKSDSELFSCPHCPFKSEFSIVLEGHLETPHMTNKREYKCNWCDFKIKDSNQLVFHNIISHKKRCRIEKPLALHICRYCPYECNSKRKIQSHILKCEQFFLKDTFLGPQDYGDYPAITSKHITQEDVKAYERTLKALRLAAYNPHQFRITGSLPQGLNGQPILVVPRQAGPNFSGARPNFTQTNANVFDLTGIVSPFRSSISLVNRNTMQATCNNIQNRNTTQAQLSQLISKQTANASIYKKTALAQTPRTQSVFVNGMTVMRSASDIVMAPNSKQNNVNGEPMHLNSANVVDRSRTSDQHGTNTSNDLSQCSMASSNPKGSTFVICEICDAYIKDLSQLKSHMQWIHKVRMHQKVLESRPPLNCQKCQWRFFTDQGLERHLLGAHGLVTSNMQEHVEKGTDAGRCTICGRAYANKLVAHMKEVHKSNLKPAHLSYKCTVCSATFNLYRLFENHVYSIHRK